MDDFGGPRFEGIRRKRSQTSRRPKAEAVQSHDQASRSSTPPSPSDDGGGKISSDENAVDANPKRKVFNLNQCAARPGSQQKREDARYSNGDANSNDGGGNENKLKKLKLKVGGVTRTVQPKSSVGAPRPRPKLILQDTSDEESVGKKVGLQGIPWKDFSRGGFSIGRENSSSMGKSKQSRKSNKRVPKKQRVLDEGDFDEEEEDDEIRYLEKLKTVKVATAAGNRDLDEDASKKQRRVSKYEDSEDPRSKSNKSESVSVDTDYEEEDVAAPSDHENDKGKKDDSPTKRETTLTSRQRALLSASAATQIEFPNGLPPTAPRKQKEKLTEVEQQLKKAEAAERRRIQNEKAARELEAEAIRKILGQDSSRKKREDKLKKRQEELQQEKDANAKTLAPSTIRTVIGPSGTVVAFAQDIGLPPIFQPSQPQPSRYPPPREKCAGPSCGNAYRYRDSKSKLPLCSLQCYKAIRQRMQPSHDD